MAQKRDPEVAGYTTVDICDRLERFPLTDLPTPVRRLRALEETLGESSLWVKCDDASGRLYGGNKPRKLEYLVADALRRGRAGVLTTGGTGTHHGLATTIAAREAGLRAVLVLMPQPTTDQVRESLLLAHAYGAELHLTESLAAGVGRIATLLAGAALRGSPLALIPTGGTSSLGAVGYVRAGLELAEQVRNGELPEPDAIFVALGTGGTAAGLIAGLRLAGLRTRVVAVLVTKMMAPTEKRLARLASTTIQRLRQAGAQIAAPSFAPNDVEIVRNYLGSDYGEPTEEGTRATELARDLETIELEATYTAKAFAAFLDAARSGSYGSNLLFWNTYSSVDTRSPVEPLPDPKDLPEPFHRFFVDRRK